MTRERFHDICQTRLLKPGFHMSGKSQTVWDFIVSRPSQILPMQRIFARGLSQTFLIMNLAGLGERAKLETKM